MVTRKADQKKRGKRNENGTDPVVKLPSQGVQSRARDTVALILVHGLGHHRGHCLGRVTVDCLAWGPGEEVRGKGGDGGGGKTVGLAKLQRPKKHFCYPNLPKKSVFICYNISLCS